MTAPDPSPGTGGGLRRAARFTAVVDVAALIDDVWALLVDWPAHGRWIPLTTVRVTAGDGHGVGSRFVARTALGPFGFDDPMEILEWDPPKDGTARCRVVKHGRLLRGGAEIIVTELAPGRTRVSWIEELLVTPAALTGPAAPLITVAGRLAFTRALRAMARELER